MEMFDRISNDIKEAMKAKDKVRLETLRNIKKVFLEAKTAPGANDTLTDDAAMKIMQKLVKQGKDSATLYTEQGRADLAEAELAQVGAEGPKDMGKVMGTATKKLAGLAEGRAISAKVKELLG